MSTDGIQITIPDLDDTDFTSTPIPFGRAGGGGAFGHGTGFGSGSGFGSHGGGFGSGSGFGGGSGGAFGFGSSGGGIGLGLAAGLESPSSITPIALPEAADRSYFHARTDSLASDDSSQSLTSTRITTGRVFGHSTQPSTSTSTSTPFAKKPSFASIRNAFKNGHKGNDIPPLPSLDHLNDVPLKSAFNRSNSSLVQGPPRKMSTARPATPLTESKRPTRSRNPSFAKSRHSHNGSLFHFSDSSSDHGYGFGSTSPPPPVPRMPGAFQARSDSPQEIDDSQVVIEPRTPADYALHAVFFRFAASAEVKIDAFLREGLDPEPLLSKAMGPGKDDKFDELLQSLAKIAQKHTKPVIDSVMRWRQTQNNEKVNEDIVNLHSAHPWTAQADVYAILAERRTLACIYIMCRAFIQILKSVPKDGLNDALGYRLEETTFEQFRRPDLKLLAQFANHRENDELYATLLGHLAKIRFVSVTDRFIEELTSVASGQMPKDLELRYEHLVSGLKHIEIKVWPTEAFEEAEEFMESLSKSFINAHGQKLKVAFSESIIHLLHPIGMTAQAEVNNPLWAKAMEVIFPRAREMATKPRYWGAAYPLMIVSLCVAPQQYFLRHWMACVDAGLSKLKEKTSKATILNGIMRLVWTYLYRCAESPSTATGKLEILLRRFFPLNRTLVIPADESHDILVYILYFVLSRYPDYGREFCLDLMQEPSLTSSSSTAPTAQVSAERLDIAVNAILLSLTDSDRSQVTPPWPSSVDFSVVPPASDYPRSSEYLPPTSQIKPSMRDCLDRCSAALAIVSKSVHSQVGLMSVFDDEWTYNRQHFALDEAHSHVTRQHAEGVVAYPIHFSAQINMLRSCFNAWPRCLHSSLPTETAIQMLIHGLFHVEPSVNEAASAALKRFMSHSQSSGLVIERLTKFLFEPGHLSNSGSGIMLPFEISRVVQLWAGLASTWISTLTNDLSNQTPEDFSKILDIISSMELGGIILLSSEAKHAYASGISIMKCLNPVSKQLSSLSAGAGHLRVVGLLHGDEIDESILHGFDEVLDKTEIDRLDHWRLTEDADYLLLLAKSQDPVDRLLWRSVYPSIVRACRVRLIKTIQPLREVIAVAASRYHPFMAQLAGLSSKLPFSHTPRPVNVGSDKNNTEKENLRVLIEKQPLIQQWSTWVNVLCSTAELQDSRPAFFTSNREHTQAPSDLGFERERMTTTRGLFRYLTPFLDSEYTIFRSAAVLCISSFPSSAYPQLLDDLNLLAARQFYDESRVKPIPGAQLVRARQERLHSAVARIYYLTADLLPRQRSAGRQGALTNVLKFVRSTQTFLSSPEARDNHNLQRLRRYFCGTVERFFTGLEGLEGVDRFIPQQMHLSLYRMCEEWCQLGPQADYVNQRMVVMQRAARNSDSQDAADKFLHETKLLTNAAIGALCALCPKALTPPDVSSGSPTDKISSDFLRPLTPSSVLDRISAILASPIAPIQARGRKALKSLLIYHHQDRVLVSETLRRSFVLGEETDSSSFRFFEIVADVIITASEHPFTFGQSVCLGLTNLCHPLYDVRRLAFALLESVHVGASGMLSMADFEAPLGSNTSSTHLRTHRLVSDFLVGEHSAHSQEILSQFTIWLSIFSERQSLFSLFILQSLEDWVSNINFLQEDSPELSREGLFSLLNLIALTLRFGTSHPEQILALWTRVTDAPHEANGHAAVRFLLEQSHKVGSIPFAQAASTIVSALSQTVIGQAIYEELCSLIIPARMLITLDHKLAPPDSQDTDLWSDLDALFAEQPRMPLGTAQFALLFLTNATFDRQWDLHQHLPTLLHAIFTQLDSRNVFVRQQCQYFLLQIVRTWSPAYGEIVDRPGYRDRSKLHLLVDVIEQQLESNLWKEDDLHLQDDPRIRSLVQNILEYFSPLTDRLAERWGTLALAWATSCSIRATAIRSLHIYRAINPPFNRSDLGLLLFRLSDSIAGVQNKMQSFTAEIIVTLSGMVRPPVPPSTLPQLFWTACACLSTTVEAEFLQVLLFVEELLSRIDLNDQETADMLISQRPHDWSGSLSMQLPLLVGLRSSTTVHATFRVLRLLTRVEDSRLIDGSGGRVRDLYIASLPWCLQAMADNVYDESLKEFATNIGHLADIEERESINRNMESFVRGRFRTKDDFLRQSVSSIREHYASDSWHEVLTLLLGMILNREKWIQVQSMQILKVLLQQKGIKGPTVLLGSELLMPLLRLLETDLAEQALEVLEEPITISGGPAAKHVLRMSLHARAAVKDKESVGDVFGTPEESGWSVGRRDEAGKLCRANVLAVFETCKMPTRPSRIDFEPDIGPFVDEPEQEDLSELVQNLHELSAFFQDSTPQVVPSSLPSRKLEARVAAILAKSVSDGIPETPLERDMFNFQSNDQSSLYSPAEDSDQYSGSDSDMDDAFIYDTPTIAGRSRVDLT